jgi:tetratricopeptide (TPR) repeat protein
MQLALTLISWLLTAAPPGTAPQASAQPAQDEREVLATCEAQVTEEREAAVILNRWLRTARVEVRDCGAPSLARRLAFESHGGQVLVRLKGDGPARERTVPWLDRPDQPLTRVHAARSLAKLAVLIDALVTEDRLEDRDGVGPKSETTLTLMSSVLGAVPAPMPPPPPPDEATARHDQIEALRRALASSRGEPDVASMHKLADLYLEEHYAVGETPKSAPNAVLAAAQYRAAIEARPSDPQVDALLLSLGEAQREAGDSKAAMATWRRLIKDFPKSKAAGDAWLYVGRLIYEGSTGNARLAEAQTALEKALKLQTSDPPVAHLVLGRVSADMGEFGAALDHLRLAVDLAGEDDPDTGDAARREFVVIYTRAGDPLTAIAEIKKVGGPLHSWDMLKELATAYHDLSRTADSTRLFRQLIQERPASPDLPMFHCHLVGYLMRGTDKKAILAEVRELAAAMKKIQAQGDFASEADRRSFNQAKAKALGIVTTLATDWHEAAQASREPAAVMIAEDICNLYLGLFPEDPPSDIRRCSEGS